MPLSETLRIAAGRKVTTSLAARTITAIFLISIIVLDSYLK